MNDDGAGLYDRRAASRILIHLAGTDPLPVAAPTAPARIGYRTAAMRFEHGSHLTLSQRLYLERFMRPCRPEQVTSATHRMSWVDEAGVTNTGHYCADGLGPIVPIAARSAFLMLRRAMGTDPGFARRSADLNDSARAVLRGTTTDHEPSEIFRVGIEAAARALTQHALLAQQTPYHSPAEFAVALRDSGIFHAVATRWFWELQASTHRRGMVPVALRADADGRLRYTPETITTLRAMKDATIADAHAVMHRARTEEGLDTEQAIAKYHDDLDLISRQYALLSPGELPVCLASTPLRADVAGTTLLGSVVDRFVAAFVDAVAHREPVPLDSVDDSASEGLSETLFTVADMNCKHCVRTITAVLTSMDIVVHDIDLERRTVRAEFRSPRNRQRAFEALRDSGYHPTGTAAPARAATEERDG